MLPFFSHSTHSSSFLQFLCTTSYIHNCRNFHSILFSIRFVWRIEKGSNLQLVFSRQARCFLLFFLFHFTISRVRLRSLKEFSFFDKYFFFWINFTSKDWEKRDIKRQLCNGEKIMKRTSFLLLFREII